ncbi:ScbR family autoregulator-binding transcription factor [Mycobacterium sp. 155]|uniref:ScbR family autoregulator-binding transcription factor n=1 Tax=Mycobacterium sp. 155 TaxID=1157943 RepID=UPI00037D3D9D|nr:ScbR family autoregulator-binding transcription factor [Mycobacterium sp. 155]
MARQARSELTRRKIIDAAVDLFSEIGYPAAGLGEIIERAELTKGAFYYHFDAKETLAAAIIEEAGARTLATFRAITASSSPALENLVHGLFMVTDFTASDKLTWIGMQLMRTFSGLNEAPGRVYGSWLEELTQQVEQAGTEGDLRSHLNPKSAAEVILSSLLGAEALSQATATGTDLRQRVAFIWELLLPAIVSDESRGYFGEFLARESLRRSPEAGR